MRFEEVFELFEPPPPPLLLDPGPTIEADMSIEVRFWLRKSERRIYVNEPEDSDGFLLEPKL